MSESMPAPKRWRFRVPQKTTLVGLLAFVAFAVVIGAVEFMTARAQIAFGQHNMKLPEGQVMASYLSIQGLTLATAALGLWAALSGKRFFWHRVWTGIFLAASAVASYLGAEAAGWPQVGALFAAGFAFAALRTWHAILNMIAKGKKQQHPLLGFPVLRWVLARGETWSAYKVMVLDSVSPEVALAAVRGEVKPVVEAEDGTTVDLSKLSKADQVRAAFQAIGGYDATPALAWLSQRGLTVDRSYVYEIGRKEAAARRSEMHALPAAA